MQRYAWHFKLQYQMSERRVLVGESVLMEAVNGNLTIVSCVPGINENP